MGNCRSKQRNQKDLVRHAPGQRRGLNNQLLGKSIYRGYWVSLISNFIPVGEWRVKLIMFALNLAALAALYGLSHWRK